MNDPPFSSLSLLLLYPNPYQTSTSILSPSSPTSLDLLLHSCITGQLCFHLHLSHDVPTEHTVVCDFTKHMPPCSLQISLPTISCNNPSLSLPVTSACLMSTDFITTPLYHMDSAFLEKVLHGVTTQMTYFTICLFQLTTWLFHAPHVILVLLFLYLTRIIPLVTYLFHLTLFKHQVLVCLRQFEISS